MLITFDPFIRCWQTRHHPDHHQDIAFLLISLLIQKSPFRTHQTVAQSVETWPGNRRVDGSSQALGGGVFDVSFYIYLGKPFDVSIMPLIAPLAWAPHCCLQLYLGVKQRSCETPIVFIRFPIIITILPLESIAGKKSGVIWCRGGAIINKIAFLLISLLIQKSPFRTHQTVTQSVETWPGNRRVDGWSPVIGGGDFNVSFYIYLGKPFDVSIMPLIAPLAWAPALLLAAIFRGQAAKLRNTYCFHTFSYYYYHSAIGVYGRKKIWCHLVQRGRYS